MRELPERLIAAAAALDRYVNPDPYGPRGGQLTLVHGDAKAENLFFFGGSGGGGGCGDGAGAGGDGGGDRGSGGGRGGAGADEGAHERIGCSACDFQWVGLGLGVTDLVYLLATSVEDRASHAALVREYHTLMQGALAGDAGDSAASEANSATRLAVHATVHEYGVALLDFVRFCVLDGVVVEDDAWLLTEANRLMCQLDGGRALQSADYEARLTEVGLS